MKKRRFQHHLTAFILTAVASPAFAANVTINNNGTFSPPVLSTLEGDTVNFIRPAGTTFERTDAIAQIGNPGGHHRRQRDLITAGGRSVCLGVAEP